MVWLYLELRARDRQIDILSSFPQYNELESPRVTVIFFGSFPHFFTHTAQDGVKALIAAGRKGNLEVVKALVVAGADVHAKDDVGGCCGGGLYMGAGVILFISPHTLFHTLPPQIGHTSLILAGLNGHLEVVKALVAAGADVNASAHVGAGRGGAWIIG